MPFSSNDPANYLALAKQSAAGTEATTGFKFVKYLSGGLNDEIESESVYEGGDGQDYGLVYKTAHKRDGEFECFARPDTFAYLAAWAMGSGVTPASVNPVEVASHIYTPNATVPRLTVEQAFGGGNAIDRVGDAQISGFTVSGEAKQPWRLAVTLVGGGTPYFRDGAASALTAVLESGDPAMHAESLYLINGATSLDVRSWSVPFERNVDDDLFTSQIHRRDVVALTRSANVEVEVLWQDANLYKTVLYNSSAASQVLTKLATGAFHAERALTASQLIAVDAPNLRFTGVEVNKLSPDGETLMLTLSAQAIKAGTGILQYRANITGRATSYLVD